MLKKAGHISLIVLLLVFTMGVTMYKHYCGTVTAKQSIAILPENCCEGPCNDCRNEAQQLKITDSFEANDAKTNFKSTITELFNHANFAIALLHITFQDNITTNLFYKVKTCENLLSTIKNSSALLQVFRL